jgi:hypothetical protein
VQAVLVGVFEQLRIPHAVIQDQVLGGLICSGLLIPGSMPASLERKYPATLHSYSSPLSSYHRAAHPAQNSPVAIPSAFTPSSILQQSHCTQQPSPSIHPSPSHTSAFLTRPPKHPPIRPKNYRSTAGPIPSTYGRPSWSYASDSTRTGLCTPISGNDTVERWRRRSGV